MGLEKGEGDAGGCVRDKTGSDRVTGPCLLCSGAFWAL